MTYKAVGFDWGGVLNGRPGKYLVNEIAELLGISYEAYVAAYLLHNKKVNRGEITWEELWKLVLGELGRPEMATHVATMSAAANADNMNEDVLNLVDNLRHAGYKLGLLSNNTHEKAALMRQKGLNKHFDVFHISAETGFVKPEPAGFQLFADELGVAMNEFIFIDDSPKSLSSAEECGYTPILFDTYDQLVQDLESLGVKT